MEENDYLKKIGFSDFEIENLMSQIQNQIDIKVLHEKIKYLISVGLDARQIRIILEENPLFITEDVENVVKNMCVLLEYIPKSSIPECLEITPEIITLDEGNLKKDIELLEKYVNKNELKLLLIDRGEIFTFVPKFLKERIEYIKNINKNISIFDLIINNIEIFELEEDEIDINEIKNMP